MASDPIERVSDLASTARDTSTGGVRKLIFLMFIVPFVTFFDKVAELIGVLFDTIIVPARAFIDGLGALILAIVGGAADIISAGSGAGTKAFLTGIWSALGPLAYPAAIATVLLAAYLMLQYFEVPETSDSVVGLFSGTDLPTDYFGADEEE